MVWIWPSVRSWYEIVYTFKSEILIKIFIRHLRFNIKRATDRKSRENMKIFQPLARLKNETDKFEYNSSDGIVLVYTENQIKSYLIISSLIICLLLLALIMTFCKNCTFRRTGSLKIVENVQLQPQGDRRKSDHQDQSSKTVMAQKICENFEKQAAENPQEMEDLEIKKDDLVKPVSTDVIVPLFCTPLFSVCQNRGQ